MVEVAPRAFEIVLHFVAALRRGQLGTALGQDWAAGHRVVELSSATMPGAGAALCDLDAGCFTTLATRAWSVGCPVSRWGAMATEAVAVIDTVTGGVGWAAASRLAWRPADFSPVPVSRLDQRLVLAIDDPTDEGMRVARLAGAKAEGSMSTVRRAILREVVLGRTFVDEAPGEAGELLAELSSGEVAE
jgi:hypothetical protein